MNSQTFKTGVKADIYGLANFLDKPGIEDDSPILTIEWGIEPEVRDFGVKGINISIKRVTGSIHYDGPEEKDGEIEFDSDTKIKGKAWEIESLMDVRENGAIFPTTIEIDFEGMKIVVE